jgi:hypothetical protein
MKTNKKDYITYFQSLTTTEMKACEVLRDTKSKKDTRSLLNLSKGDLDRIIVSLLKKLECLGVRAIMDGKFGNKHIRGGLKNEKAL